MREQLPDRFTSHLDVCSGALLKCSRLRHRGGIYKKTGCGRHGCGCRKRSPRLTKARGEFEPSRLFLETRFTPGDDSVMALRGGAQGAAARTRASTPHQSRHQLYNTLSCLKLTPSMTNSSSLCFQTINFYNRISFRGLTF